MKCHCHSLSWKAWNKYRHLSHIFKTLIFLFDYQYWKRTLFGNDRSFEKSTSTFSTGSSPRSLGSALSPGNLISAHTFLSSWPGSCAHTQGFTEHSVNQAKKNADGSVFYYSWDLDVVEVQIMTQKTFVSLSASVPEQADPTEGKNTLYYFIFFSSFLTPLLLVPFIAHIKQTVTLWHTKIFMHYTSYLTMARNAHNELVKNLDSLAISLCMFYLFSSESLHEQNTKTIKQTKQKPQD